MDGTVDDAPQSSHMPAAEAVPGNRGCRPPQSWHANADVADGQPGRMEMVHMPLVARDSLARSRLMPPRPQPRLAEINSSGSDEDFDAELTNNGGMEVLFGADTSDGCNSVAMKMNVISSPRRMVLVQSPSSARSKREPVMANAQFETVTLNLYKLGLPGSCSAQVFNTILDSADVGAFHCGVQIYGREWSFQQTLGGGSGVFCCMPRKCHNVTFAESVRMGTTPLTPETVKRLIDRLRREWPGNSYDLLKNNCCHFCECFCQHLKVGSLPDYVTYTASSLAHLDDKRAQCGEAFTQHQFCLPSVGCNTCCKGSDCDEIVEISPNGTRVIQSDPRNLKRNEKSR